MLKELWILVKLLFATRPSDYLFRDLEVITMQHFPFKGKRFMSWCGKIVAREEKTPIIERFLQTFAGAKAKNHEGGHVVQAITCHGDNWARYYLDYLWHWIKHCPWVSPGHAAYYLNRYECECYAKEDDFTYFDLDNYSRTNLRTKYRIKHAKKLYRQLGSTPAAWKQYIKTL